MHASCFGDYVCRFAFSGPKLIAAGCTAERPALGPLRHHVIGGPTLDGTSMAGHPTSRMPLPSHISPPHLPTSDERRESSTMAESKVPEIENPRRVLAVALEGASDQLSKVVKGEFRLP